MTDITERLTKLEKTNKRMRIFTVGAITLAVGMATLAATSDERESVECECNGLAVNGNATVSGNLHVDYEVIAPMANLDQALIHEVLAVLGNSTFYQDISVGGNIDLWQESTFYGPITLHEGQTYLMGSNGESLEVVLDDLQTQITGLQAELQECCGAVATCPSDLDDDDEVGIHDLLALIADWGDCS